MNIIIKFQKSELLNTLIVIVVDPICWGDTKDRSEIIF